MYQETINGITYYAKFKGIKFYNEILSECKNSKNKLIQSKLAEILFKEILVEPKIDIDDISDEKEFFQIFNFLEKTAKGICSKYTKSSLLKEVENEWACWRLLMSDISNLDYDTVFNKMTPKDIDKANIALDKVIKQIKKHSK